MKLNLNIPDFDEYLSDQQFVNVVEALEKIETSQGGLPVEDIWNAALQVVEQLKHSVRPDVKAHRLTSLIKSQLESTYQGTDVDRSTHCILFCVNYLLCANDEEPDPNQQVIDNISSQLSKMSDIRELVEAVTIKEDDEWYNHGREVEPRNCLLEKPIPVYGAQHELTSEDLVLFDRLLSIADKGYWTGGVTTESMKNGLKKTLGIEVQLDSEMHKMSENLWRMFRKRKGCNADRSFMVTWLNIVGWCRTNGMIEGSSPSLTKEFFTRYGEDDYKAIDKGSNGEIHKFQDIVPLLEVCLKPNNKT